MNASRFVLLPLWCLALATPCLFAQRPGDADFTPLFNGEDLEGWEGNTELWRVEDGAIVGDSPGIDHNEFLCTEREYGDFELRLEFRLVGGAGNSGVQFRSQRVPESTEVSGYQADLGDGWWGCLYDEARRNRVLVEAPAELLEVLDREGWNTYTVCCIGPNVTLAINDFVTVDYVEEEADIATSGVIALQVHGGDAMRVEFRNIRIREL